MRTPTSLRPLVRASLSITALAASASVGPPAARAEGTADGPRAPIVTTAVAFVVSQATRTSSTIIERPTAHAASYSAVRAASLGFDPPTRLYRVTGPVAAVGGVALASAYDRGTCAIGSWGPGAIDLVYTPDPADRAGPMRCAVVFTKVNERAAVTAPLAYGFFGFPTVTTQVAPISFGFNSASPVAADAPRATRTGPGRYRVEIPRMAAGDTSGNVQVAPYGAGGRVCRIGPLSRSGEDSLAFDVRCDDTLSPRPADTAFTFLFTRGSDAWGHRLGFASGVGGPDGLLGAAGVPSAPTLSADTLSIPGASADSVALVTSTKDDAVCRPSFGPSPTTIPIRCDGGRRAGYSFLVLR